MSNKESYDTSTFVIIVIVGLISVCFVLVMIHPTIQQALQKYFISGTYTTQTQAIDALNLMFILALLVYTFGVALITYLLLT